MLPELKGFSARNLKYIRAFAEAWPDSEFVQQPVAQLPWGHHLVLLTKLKNKSHQPVLLELGAGFAFVGRQVHLEVGEQDFYLDLLFYHLKLRCYLVVELKAGDFKDLIKSLLSLSFCSKSNCCLGFLNFYRPISLKVREVL